jgi:PIN domain-containing protein
VNVAYVDTSCLVAIRFDEPGAHRSSEHLAGLDRMFSSNLLEAEFLGALVREGTEGDNGLLAGVSWILPDRPLRPEISRVLRAGYVRGSDLWHLATALYLAETPGELCFLTLDARQREIAQLLGFPTD